MRIVTFLTLLFLGLSFNLFSQTRMLQGRLISEDFEYIPYAEIQISDSIVIGHTDINGSFKLEVPLNTEKIIFTFIAMEPATVILNNDCNIIEVVMMNDVIYDYKTFKQIDRLRSKRFARLVAIHKQAFKNGIFSASKICYKQEFKKHNVKKPSS